LELVVDKFGVHDDPFFNFIAREEKLGEVTLKIVSLVPLMHFVCNDFYAECFEGNLAESGI